MIESITSNLEHLRNFKTIDEAHIYMKLCILLYADDTVIFSDNQEDLQNALNVFKKYCDTWKLTVNVSKTKVMLIVKVNQKIKNNMNISISVYFQQKTWSFYKI